MTTVTDIAPTPAKHRAEVATASAGPRSSR